MFQFYLSSIKRIASALLGGSYKEFQFYLSSIKSLALLKDWAISFMFQFYLSSIKSNHLRCRNSLLS